MCETSDTTKGVNNDVAIFSCNAGDRRSLTAVRTKKLMIPSKPHVCANWSVVMVAAAGKVCGSAPSAGNGPFML